MINNFLDKLVRPEVHILHRPWSAFQVCGFIGLVLAILLTTILVMRLELSLWMMLGIVFLATSTGLTLAIFTKIFTGGEKLVCYHQKIAVMVVVALVLWVSNQPVLIYLDVTILGVGMYLACIRIGCFMVGCCHGKPHNWGVCYREAHAAGSFTPCLVGVRLFPIQIVESLWCLIIVSVGIVFVGSGRVPGEAFAWYVVTYCVGRFFFEFMRGDHDHTYFLSLSEPQWTSLVIVLALSAAEIFGIFPFHIWHIGASACLMSATLAIVLITHLRKNSTHQLLYPTHIKEVAKAVILIHPMAGGLAIPDRNSAPENIPLRSTSLGIQISSSRIKNGTSNIHHYALSHQDGNMTEEAAKTLGGLILRLKHPSSSSEIVKGNRGVFHLLIHTRHTDTSDF